MKIDAKALKGCGDGIEICEDGIFDNENHCIRRTVLSMLFFEL